MISSRYVLANEERGNRRGNLREDHAGAPMAVRYQGLERGERKLINTGRIL